MDPLFLRLGIVSPDGTRVSTLASLDISEASFPNLYKKLCMETDIDPLLSKAANSGQLTVVGSPGTRTRREPRRLELVAAAGPVGC